MPQSGLAESWLDEGRGEATYGGRARATGLRERGPTGSRERAPREQSRERSAGERERILPGDGLAGVNGAGLGVPGRRTITITGRGAVDRLYPPSQRRRPARMPHERPGFRPDRTAMWAVLLCVLMILAAATSSHAATLHLRAPHGSVHAAPASARVLAAAHDDR